MKTFFLIFVLVSATSLSAIIGQDDRREWYEVGKALRDLGRSVAAIVDKRSLARQGHSVVWHSSVLTHQDQDDLSSDEKYVNQRSPADCTSFLIDERHVMTASHCFTATEKKTQGQKCADARLVFDFLSPREGQVVSRFFRHQVFRCKQITYDDPESDHLILELDRPTVARRSFKFTERPTRVGTRLILMGFPRGIPLKIVGGARVRAENKNADEKIYFEAMLDAFGGNSGGPVLNARTLEVEGIMTTSFGEFDSPKTGKRLRKLRRFTEEEATPTWVSRISQK